VSDDNKPDPLDWLGLRWQPDYSNARWLGRSITGAFLLLVLFLIVPTVLEFFRAVTGLDNFATDEAQSTAIRNPGLALAAVVGVPFVVWRSVVAQKQVNVAQEGLITDRINKAVEGLGAEKTVDRIGRPVTVWTGKPKTVTHLDYGKFSMPPRSAEVSRYHDITQVDPDRNDDIFEGLHIEVKT